MRINRVFVVVGLVLFVFSALASAVVIDFEAQGLAHGEGHKIGTINIGGVNVTFSLQGSTNKPILVEYGDTGPSTSNRMLGFNNLIAGRDTPSPTDTDSDPKTVAGPANSRFFLTNSNRGPENLMNYVISFDQLVNNVSLLVYDYRADGNNSDGRPGVDKLELRGFNGANPVGTDSWTVPSPRPVDGVVTRLALSPSTAVNKLVVAMMGSDFGTGIDNVSFEVVPEPNTASLLGMLFLGSLGLRRRLAA